MSARVAVAASVLLWAEQRSQRDSDAYAKKFKPWEEWIAGDEKPTIKQVEEIAKYSHLPFGVFFLDEPPKVELPIPDYRLGRAGDEELPSQDLLEAIDLSLQRQAWFKEYAAKLGLGPADITRATTQDDPTGIATKVAAELEFTDVARAKIKTREAARNHLRRAFEARGGLAIFTSMVGNDTHRLLDREEFRGFTLADEIVPLIFVNTNEDSLGGQFFTFLHEYGHVVLRSTGISNEDQSVPGTGVEAWCTAVANEVLVPAADLGVQFNRNVDLTTELERLSNRYLCSTLVILLKLRTMELIAAQGFDAIYRAEEQRVAEVFALRRAQNSKGGDYYANQPFRIGERLSRAVLGDVREGGTSYTEAFRILGLRTTEQLAKYATQLGL